MAIYRGFGTSGAGQPVDFNFVERTGDTMTGHLNVPTGATGAQVPQRADVDTALALKADLVSPAITGTPTITTSSGDALTITNTGTGDSFVVNDASGDTTPFVIDAAGRHIIGHTTALSTFSASGSTPTYQQIGVSSATTTLSATSFSVSGVPSLLLARSPVATIGDYTAVPVDTVLGRIQFQGSDGTDFGIAGYIECAADGEFGTLGDASDAPGRLVFSTTADGTGSPLEAMRINSAQRVMIGSTTDDGVNKLQVTGSTKVTGDIETTGVIGVGDAINASMGIKVGSTTTPLLLTGAANYGTQYNIQASTTATAVYGIQMSFDTNTSGSVTNYYGFNAANPTVNVGGALLTTYGFRAANQSGTTANYGFSSTIPNSVAANRSLYITGGAPSYHASSFMIGSNVDSGDALQVTGDSLFTGNAFHTSKAVTTTNSLTTATISTRYRYFTGTAGASFAITLPAAASTIDGEVITIMSTAARASTTWISTGATFVGAPTALVANTPVKLQYHHATTQWFITA